MRLSVLIRETVEVVRPDSNLQEAARKMLDFDIGAISSFKGDSLCLVNPK